MPPHGEDASHRVLSLFCTVGVGITGCSAGHVLAPELALRHADAMSSVRRLVVHGCRTSPEPQPANECHATEAGDTAMRD